MNRINKMGREERKGEEEGKRMREKGEGEADARGGEARMAS